MNLALGFFFQTAFFKKNFVRRTLTLQGEPQPLKPFLQVSSMKPLAADSPAPSVPLCTQAALAHTSHPVLDSI